MRQAPSLLVLVLTSPAERGDTLQRLRELAPGGGHALYLTRSGVLWSLGPHREALMATRPAELYVHGPDLEARGLRPEPTGLQVQDTPGLVELLMERYLRSVTL